MHEASLSIIPLGFTNVSLTLYLHDGGDCTAQQPQHRFVGATCVELGAGIGLCGILLAKLGAQVPAHTANVGALLDAVTWHDDQVIKDYALMCIQPHHLLQVVLTDVAQVLHVMQSSIALNGLAKHR